MGLETGWIRIGRSGLTIDGREIEDQWLLEAAETYDPEFFEAAIWPGHTDYYRLGSVTGVRAENNDEGGVDLYARLDPNSYYRYQVDNGQLLHTSMELTPDFRGSGKWYLEGLAATDQPASVATTKVQFSKRESIGKGAVFSDFVESKPHTFEVKKQKKKSKFKNLFKSKSNEDDMDKKLLLELQEKMSGFESMAAKFSAFIDADKAPDKTPDKPASTDFEKETTDKIDKLTALFETLQAKLEGDKETPTKEEFTAFVADLKTVKDTLAVALSKQEGTPTPEHDGAQDEFETDC